jgi:predicted nuclease of restriction endonuclease-like RecB superfamily
MLRWTHVAPFVVVRAQEVQLRFLADPDGRAVALLDRMCRLVRRLEGRPRSLVLEALRRQERRVKDSRRLAGVSKALLDLCAFEHLPGAERAPEIRDALWRARGDHWPPMPGDRALPYQQAATQLGLTSDDVERLLYADRTGESILKRAPAIDGPTLLDRYNLELARGVLLNARSLTLSARGGWRGIFAAVKLARLMYRLERAGVPGKRRGGTYRVELSGPAAPFVVRPERYGARLARVVPALVRAPGWSMDAALGDLVVRNQRYAGLRFRLNAANAPFASRRQRRRYDSRWERGLALDFARLMREERGGWKLEREVTPVTLGSELFLPDFTLRRSDGREVIVEIVGFWTPEYLETKLRKVRESGIENVVLVVFRGLAVGASAGALEELGESGARIVWFTNRPRIQEVLQAAEEVAGHTV